MAIHGYPGQLVYDSAYNQKAADNSTLIGQKAMAPIGTMLYRHSTMVGGLVLPLPLS